MELIARIGVSVWNDILKLEKRRRREQDEAIDLRSETGEKKPTKFPKEPSHQCCKANCPLVLLSKACFKSCYQ